MNHNAGTVPFNYGDLVSITEGPTFWFQDKLTGVIRGVRLVADKDSYRLQLGDNEIHVRRAGADSTPRPGARTPLPGTIPPLTANQQGQATSKSS